jgi:hypothetical protein
MVTHELDIAQHATRIIRFVDGLVVEDHAVTDRRDARQELEEIRQAQADKDAALASTA